MHHVIAAQSTQAMATDHRVLHVARSKARKQDSNTEFHRVGTELHRAEPVGTLRLGSHRQAGSGARRSISCSAQLCANSVKLCVRILLSCWYSNRRQPW